MAQIRPVTSESLESTIRRLLPSQQGFGEDLQASNVIQPVIDLTPTAEGSILPDYLQQAIGYDEQIGSATGTTTVITSTAGFYRIRQQLTGTGVGTIDITDGTTAQLIWGGSNTIPLSNVPLYVFVPVGYSLRCTSAAVGLTNTVYYAQVADVSGVLSDPFGFQPQ